MFDIHEWTYKRLEKAKGSSNPLYYCEGGAFMKVGYDESIKPIVEGMTASLGYIGLEETCQAMFGKPLHECQEFAGEVMDYLWSKVEEYKKRDGRLYTLYSTPAESLIGRFQMINRKKHGVIKDVTSRDYMSNSFHVGVWRKLNPVKKLTVESPLFAKAHGGRICYTEFPYNVDHQVLKQVVEYGMDKGLYQGVNIESCNCMDCGHQGEFEVCPKCGSDNVTTVNRCCGYLSFSKIKGDSRYNESKRAEVRERVIHLQGYSRGNEE